MCWIVLKMRALEISFFNSVSISFFFSFFEKGWKIIQIQLTLQGTKDSSSCIYLFTAGKKRRKKNDYKSVPYTRGDFFSQYDEKTTTHNWRLNKLDYLSKMVITSVTKQEHNLKQPQIISKYQPPQKYIYFVRKTRKILQHS